MTGTFQLHISGIVQGVGFRPYIYNLAFKQQLYGWVCNTSSGVFIRINTGSEKAKAFLKKIKEGLPEKAIIVDSSIEELPHEIFSNFSIIESFEGAREERTITPDYAICPECLQELSDPSNRREAYSFITCTNCGPRYSIIEELPYDRVRTSMKNYEMCPKCSKEYNDPGDRRFYSQTNSCRECGIKMKLYTCSGASYLEDQALIIPKVCTELKKGKIIAIKGIGGYMFIADGHNAVAIKKLRERKNRPEKPFALMVKDEEMLDRYVDCSAKQKDAFSHSSAPIVLFDTILDNTLPLKLIAPYLSEIGIVKAYSALHYQILALFDQAIIATSGNLSGCPIIYNDHDATASLSSIADYILLHDRNIVSAQDDSLIRFTKSDTTILIRRARGLAPSFLRKKENTEQYIIAFGAMLKSTFSIVFKGNTFVSHYIGNSNSYETQQSYLASLERMQSLFGTDPDIVLCDKHQGYFSHEFAQLTATKNAIPLIKIQHHKAHFTAILGEHELWNEKVCGIVWDGTGLGDDNNIWGGEAFILDNNCINHIHQLPYQTHILGDKMVNEPRISALSFFQNNEKALTKLKEKFSPIEWQAFSHQIETSSLKTSSIGRLFDAVASILGLKDITSFHGQAAMLLEAHALNYPDQKEFTPYPICNSEGEFDLMILLRNLFDDIENKYPSEGIALRFHQTMLKYIEWIAKRSNTSILTFSGGVFQNKLLVELIHQHLGNDYELYFHTRLSPNDESISFGQLMYYLHIDRYTEP